MRLRFPGTRGEIEARTERHSMHSVLQVAAGRGQVTVDCGLDWLGRLDRLSPRAILITHAHPDHAGGLRDGAPCPVWATDASWKAMRRYPIDDRRVIEPGAPQEIEGLMVEAFALEHSIRAPAVAYRVTARSRHEGSVARSILYAPDVALILDPPGALSALTAYVGDGASLVRPILRKRDGALIGHAPMATQLEWCREQGVTRAIFSHCGSQIVKGDESVLGRRLAELADACGVTQATIAYDGLDLEV